MIGITSIEFETQALRGFPFPPCGEALSRYVDYIELQEARKASEEASKAANKANRHAMWAIGIALIALIVQVLFGVVADNVK